jgi:hypothetical protein
MSRRVAPTARRIPISLVSRSRYQHDIHDDNASHTEATEEIMIKIMKKAELMLDQRQERIRVEI